MSKDFNSKTITVRRPGESEKIPNPFVLFFLNRKVIWALVFSELKKQYAKNLLGVAWIFLFPFLFMCSYSLLFVMILNTRPELFSSSEYILVIFCGLMPFLAFSESFSRAASALISNQSLIKSTPLQMELIPIVEVLLGQVTGLAGISIVMFIGVFVGFIGMTAPLVFIIWGSFILFLIGLSYLFAPLVVLLNDLQRVIPMIIMFSMMLSPIAYTVDMLPAALKFINYLNPLAYFIMSIQGLMLKSVTIDPVSILGALIIGPGFLMLGYSVQEKLKTALLERL